MISKNILKTDENEQGYQKKDLYLQKKDNMSLIN